MTERETLNLLLARRDNYSISDVTHGLGRAYFITMAGKMYTAVILPTAFSFYRMRYHLLENVPNLVVCFLHDTVVPIKCIALKGGHIAEPYDLPEHITDVKVQRHKSKIGSQVLLGMYLCGMKEAQKLVDNFKPTTRKRYIARARELSKRRPGRPVEVPQTRGKS